MAGRAGHGWAGMAGRAWAGHGRMGRAGRAGWAWGWAWPDGPGGLGMGMGMAGWAGRAWGSRATYPPPYRLRSGWERLFWLVTVLAQMG
jgi:hypothetical protein